MLPPVAPVTTVQVSPQAAGCSLLYVVCSETFTQPQLTWRPPLPEKKVADCFLQEIAARCAGNRSRWRQCEHDGEVQNRADLANRHSTALSRVIVTCEQQRLGVCMQATFAAATARLPSAHHECAAKVEPMANTGGKKQLVRTGAIRDAITGVAGSLRAGLQTSASQRT